MSPSAPTDPTNGAPQHRRFQRKPTKKQTLARRKNAAKARKELKHADQGLPSNLQVAEHPPKPYLDG